MKGYSTSYGYMGYDPCTCKYNLYSSEDEYVEIYKERMKDHESND